jgi:hydroxymethylpyrimidine pyrophosphatase-like HAD family hydrolase
MQYHVLAVDYDGTLATDGRVDERTIDALHRLRQSGRRLVLVTGRIMEQLRVVFPQIGLCDLVVADNGALIYDPHADEYFALADPPPPEFVEELAKRGVSPIEIGNVIVATWEPHESTVLKTIQDLALELQIIFNKGAVMILPTGVNKATGLRAALTRLGMSHHNTVGIGDAENDEAFLKLCGTSAAVDNALDVVKRRVDVVTLSARGAGVTELINRLVADDLSPLRPRPDREILIGADAEGHESRIPVYGMRVLLMGDPGGIKSKFACGVVEQLVENDYQVCVITSESHYQCMSQPVVLGTSKQPPAINEVLQVIEDPYKSCIVSLSGVSRDKQPDEFCSVLRSLVEHRSRAGHPHWILVDDAGYLIPANWTGAVEQLFNDLTSVMYVTAFPDHLPQPILRNADLLVAVGDQADARLAACCESLNEPAPTISIPADGAPHQAIAWLRGISPPQRLHLAFARALRTSHESRHVSGVA